MIWKLIHYLFTRAVINLPPERRQDILDRFENICVEAIAAAAEGAAQGLKKSDK